MAGQSGSWCNSSISPCEGDGPGANPGFLTILENKNARRALKEIGLSASGFCSESNPSPGTKISTPEFGCELFVAHKSILANCQKLQAEVVHRHGGEVTWNFSL